jgi:NADPH:quinone reductase-like Zn-dependent oxidoreductase
MARNHNRRRASFALFPVTTAAQSPPRAGDALLGRPNGHIFQVPCHRKDNAMKIYRLHEFSGPRGLRVEEAPGPTPGPGQILIRLRAVSVNSRDLMVAKGIYNPKLRLPLVPVSDGAGEVAVTGAGVTRFKPGDRVVACFMPGWLDGPPDEEKARTALGAGGDGLLAEEAVLPEQGVLPIPRHLSFEEAATLPCAAVTAWNALVASGGLKPGDSVLTLGTGGVSLFALQLAKLAGARVIATSGNDEKLRRALELGAAEGINYKTTTDWDKRARELTGGKGVGHVVEVGGAGTLPKSLRAVRMGGSIALIGVLSGAGDVNPVPILMKHIRVQGIFVGSRSMFEDMNRAIEASQLHPVIDRVFPFEQAVAAFEHMESGAQFGKIVIRI